LLRRSLNSHGCPGKEPGKGENDKYQLTLTAQAGGFRFDTGKKSATVEASIKDGRLYLAEEIETMVMEKF